MQIKTTDTLYYTCQQIKTKHNKQQQHQQYFKELHILLRMWNIENTPPLVVWIQTYTFFLIQFDGFSENWDEFYHKTHIYHSWAHIQMMLYYIPGKLTQLCL